jgi:hypothetical protein
MKRSTTSAEALAIAGIGLEGVIAALILSAVRDFSAGSLIAALGMAAAGAGLGVLVRASRGMVGIAITTGATALLVVASVVLFAIGDVQRAIVVGGLGLVFVSAAEGTRRALAFVSFGGMR